MKNKRLYLISAAAVALLLLAALVPAVGQELINGYRAFAELAAPGSPAPNFLATWADSTNHLFSAKNSSGVTTHTVATSACSGGTPVVGNINADGSVTCAAGGGGGGSFVLVEQHTAAGVGELDFTTGITSTYDEYQIEVVNLTVSTSSALVGIQFSSNGGGVWDTGASYDWCEFGFGVSASSGSNCAAGATTINFFGGGVLNSATPAIVLSAKLYTPADTGNFKSLITNGYGVYTNGTRYYFVGGGTWNTTAAGNAFRVIASAGTYSGIVRLYGIAH